MQRKHNNSFPRTEQFPVRAELPVAVPPAAVGYHVQATDRPGDPKYVFAIWLITCVPMSILALGLGGYYGWELAITVVVLALLLIVGTLVVVLVAGGQWGVTVAIRADRRVRERLITSEKDVFLAQTQAHKEVQLAQIEADSEVQRYHVQQQAAARLAIAAQVEQHSAPQSHSNQLANYVEPEPFEDELRDKILSFLIGCYPNQLAKGGRIVGRVPWGARGDWAPSDKARTLRMFRDAKAVAGCWVVRQSDNLHWYVNVERFPSAGLLVKLFNAVHTPR